MDDSSGSTARSSSRTGPGAAADTALRIAPSDAEDAGGQAVSVLYIAGFGRSGSTLLDRLLGSDSMLHSGGEIGGIWSQGLVADRLCSCGVRFSCCKFWQAVGAKSFSSLRPHEITAIAQYTQDTFPVRRMWRIISRRTRQGVINSAPHEFWNVTERLYRAIREESARQVVVDSSKLATYLAMLAQLDAIDVHIVHLVRDPRAVAHSWMRPQVADPDGRTTMPRFGGLKSAILWIIMNSVVEWLAWQMGLPYVRIRYEDLVRDPRRITDQIQAVPLTNGELHIREPRPIENDNACFSMTHSISGNPMRFQQGHVPIVEDVEWKTGPRARRIAVALITLPLRWRYGYRERPWRPWRRIPASGSALSRSGIEQ